MTPTVWVCGACGSVRETYHAHGSCIFALVECWRSSVVYRMNGLASYAVTADTDWVEPAEPEPPRRATARQVEARERRLAARVERRAKP